MNSSSSLFCFSLVCTVLLNCLCIFVFEWQVNKRTLAHIHFHYQCSHIKSICCYLHSVIITILPFYKLFAFIDKFTPLFRLKYNVSLLLVVKSRRNSLEKKILFCRYERLCRKKSSFCWDPRFVGTPIE